MDHTGLTAIEFAKRVETELRDDITRLESRLVDRDTYVAELERRAAVAVKLIEHGEPPLQATSVLLGKDQR